MSAVAAARLGDEVAHGFGLLAMVAGAVVGAVVGVAIVGATVATGGVAVAIIAGSVAAGGMSLGQLVKGLTKKFNLPEPASGVLMLGSRNVRFNSRAAMRANLDIAACSGLPFNHPGQPAVPIAQGSGTVRINGMPAARLNDKLMCGAHIKSGSPNIFIGGPTAQVRSIYDTEEWAEYSLTALGIFAIGVGGGAAFVAGGLAGLAMFSGITGGIMLGFEGIGRLGDCWGPGGRDILQGAAGLLLLGLGPKLARSSQSSKNGVDFMEGKGRLNGELYPQKKLQQLGQYLQKRGITLLVGDEHLPPGKAGGFDASRRLLALKSDPTKYEVWHELSHFKQYQNLGFEAYNAQSRVQKEQFVFDMLENNKRLWDALNFDEQQHAIEYIYRVGGFR